MSLSSPPPTPSAPCAQAVAYSRQLLAYIDASPSPFHAVAQSVAQLKAAGFQELREADSWDLAPSGRYYVVRGGGSLMAFQLGSQPPAEAGFHVVGAHTDSPNLRLKPRLAKSAHGQVLLDVEPYGGLLVATFADRDLALAGRVLVRTDAGVEPRLVRSAQPVARVPNLAIHLNRTVNDEGLKLNKHQHLSAVFALDEGEQSAGERVLAYVAGLAGCAPEDVLGHDLCLFDAQAGTIGGADQSYINVARLDNLASCYMGLTALLEAVESPATYTRVLGLFDHEEVGSRSSRGADGSFLPDVLGRLAGTGADALPRAMARSYQVSADMAHALHPNYADRHDGTHQPRINAGPVIKTNVNTRYATDGETEALFRRVCQLAEVPVQSFVNRPDLACGSTIGSITAAALGLRTVDVGNPMWAMHSAREMAGTSDGLWMHRALSQFYRL